MALLLCALSYGTESQGAFYNGPFHVFVVLMAAALVSSVVCTRPSTWWRGWWRDPLVVTAAALSLVTVASSAAAGQPGGAVGPVSLLLCLMAVVAVVRSLRPEHRGLLAAGVVVIAVVVALVGWAADVGRWPPDALTSQGLWRAASTLTYENALAAFLTTPLLLCLDRLMTTPGRRPLWSGAAYVLLVGVGASLSRGGVLGLAVGIGLLALLRRPRTLVALWRPVAGAVVALLCLAPSVPVTSSPHVLLAVAGLLVGGGMALWSAPAGGPMRMAAAGAGLAAVGLLVAVAPIGHVLRQIAQTRASAASSDRAHEWAAALDVARHHLVLGTGMARVLLHWQAGGQAFTVAFAHNEFLQLLMEDGVIGVAVLVAGLAAVFVSLARRRRRTSAWPADCAMACLAALLAQSALDFLWHLPVIPVVTVVALAVALAPGEPSQPVTG
jgi:hypothetical protein